FEPSGQHEPHPHEDVSEPTLESSFVADDELSELSRDGRAPPPPIDEEMEFEPSDEEGQPRPSYRDLTKGLAIPGLVISIGCLLLWPSPTLSPPYPSFPPPPRPPLRMRGRTPRRRGAPRPPRRPNTPERSEPARQRAPGGPAPAPGAGRGVPAGQKVVL